MGNELSVSLPPEALKDNITFVDLDRYPNTVRDVTEDEAREFFNLYRTQVSWCHDWLMKLKGFGISFPQIGVPINAAVMRFNLQQRPGLFLNICHLPNKAKKRTSSMEACYSVGFGAVPFSHTRWRKINAQWRDPAFVLHDKVMRIPNPSREVQAGHIFQHECEHMLDDFPAFVSALLKQSTNFKPRKKILALVDEIKGGMRQIEPIFDPMGKYHVFD